MSGQQDNVSRSVSPTILVVDDEPNITKLCKATLQQAGFSVLDADGSSEALKICTQHEGPIDLLLTGLSIGLKLQSISPRARPRAGRTCAPHTKRPASDPHVR